MILTNSLAVTINIHIVLFDTGAFFAHETYLREAIGIINQILSFFFILNRMPRTQLIHSSILLLVVMFYSIFNVDRFPLKSLVIC